jgi:hypothetical protein
MSASYATTSNPDSISSSGTGVDHGIKCSKSTYPNEVNVRMPFKSSISHIEELRLYSMVYNLTISNIGMISNQFLQMHLLVEWLGFCGVMIMFYEGGSQNLWNGSNVAS